MCCHSPYTLNYVRWLFCSDVTAMCVNRLVTKAGRVHTREYSGAVNGMYTLLGQYNAMAADVLATQGIELCPSGHSSLSTKRGGFFNSLKKNKSRKRYATKRNVTLTAMSSMEGLILSKDSPLQWHLNGRDCVSNHKPYDCLLNSLFRHRSKKKIKAPRHWPLWGEFTGDRWVPRTNGQ